MSIFNIILFKDSVTTTNLKSEKIFNLGISDREEGIRDTESLVIILIISH